MILIQLEYCKKSVRKFSFEKANEGGQDTRYKTQI